MKCKCILKKKGKKSPLEVSLTVQTSLIMHVLYAVSVTNKANRNMSRLKKRKATQFFTKLFLHTNIGTNVNTQVPSHKKAHTLPGIYVCEMLTQYEKSNFIFHS